MTTAIKTTTEFTAFSDTYWEGKEKPAAFGVGIVTKKGDQALEVWYLSSSFGNNFGSLAALLGPVVGATPSGATYLNKQWLQKSLELFKPFEGDGKHHPNIDAIRGIIEILRGQSEHLLNDLGYTDQEVVVYCIPDVNAEPKDVEDVYLRLHLLSECEVQPHGVNLDGAFGILQTLAFTSHGAVLPEDLPKLKIRARTAGQRVTVANVDKFPRMADYVVPPGVRIGDADRVRLGACLAPGTTVMHEGFVNFNAGTLGASMVEGRISAGVVIGDGTDVGGGASIMGTLSGGGTEVISLGKRCLLGANSGIGISLGNDCVVEAGLYVTAGTKVLYKPSAFDDAGFVKASELSGRNKLRFWRNSTTGAVEAHYIEGKTVELNEDLHASN